MALGKYGISKKKRRKNYGLWTFAAAFGVCFSMNVFASEIFWGAGEARYGSYISTEEAASLAQVSAVVEQFKQTYIREDMSLFEKEMAIIDYLIKNVEYEDDYEEKGTSQEVHSAYGALVEGKAVCDGYTKAFMELADACGIETQRVVGYVPAGGHAWNLVKLDDNEWYHVDVTFADTGAYSVFNYDKEQMKAADAYSTSIEGLGDLRLDCINYPDEFIAFDHIWDSANYPAARGYLYGPKVADEYFMNGVIDFSLAKPYEEIAQVINANDNAHNRRSAEILADFSYVIPFTTWDETMKAAQAYLRSAPKENLRLAIKYESWSIYSAHKGEHPYIFAYELTKEPGQYGFRPFTIGEWYLTTGSVSYDPFDEQKPYYDIIFSYKAGDERPYSYNE